MFSAPKRKLFSLLYVVLFIIIIKLLRNVILGQFYEGNNDIELLNCNDYKYLTTSSVISEGWNKLVLKGTWKNISVALKTINAKGHALRKCSNSQEKCIEKQEKNLAQEAHIFKSLNHSSVLKLYGYCFPPSNRHIRDSSLIMEFGHPVDSFLLVQKDFKSRLKQFVIAQNTFKLCDVDDLQIGERPCYSNSHCVSDLKGKDGNIQVPCKNGKCYGLNDLVNVWKACRTIFPYLLSFGAPKSAQDLIEKILLCRENSVDSLKLDTQVKGLIDSI
ncbi:Extracellular tyrosine-protein kinase PKDCC [Armadillidium nasatum]|uniref:Extracellular tyrosine-protein kinase PKDCC n=1 Tax=Armadillidium nasatum TaxID=96803 RepID=A0A5N5SZG9_9CRUS|nr:Extracellular tyrosine-protein kinase PKDCC [Armadillidium nasatum]